MYAHILNMYPRLCLCIHMCLYMCIHVRTHAYHVYGDEVWIYTYCLTTITTLSTTLLLRDRAAEHPSTLLRRLGKTAATAMTTATAKSTSTTSSSSRGGGGDTQILASREIATAGVGSFQSPGWPQEEPRGTVNKTIQSLPREGL